METVGEYLRKIRKEKGIGLRELSRRADISHSYLSQIENGNKKEPKSYILRALAQELDVDYKELLDKTDYVADWHYLVENLQENIKKILVAMTDDSGYFFPRFRGELFEAIKTNLYIAPVFYNFPDPKHYEELITAYFSNPDDEDSYSDRDHLEMEEDFNKAFNIRTLKKVMDSSSTNIEELESFYVALEQVRKSHNIEIEENEKSNEVDLHDIINKPNVTYKNIALSDKDKIVIAAYLEGLFTNRE